MVVVSNLSPDGGDRLSLLDLASLAQTRFSVKEMLARTFQLVKRLGKMQLHATFNLTELKSAAIAQNATGNIRFECEEDEGAIITGIDFYGTDLATCELKIKDAAGNILIPHGMSGITGTRQEFVTMDKFRFPAKSYIEMKKGDKLDFEIKTTAAAGDTITTVLEWIDPDLNKIGAG